MKGDWSRISRIANLTKHRRKNFYHLLFKTFKSFEYLWNNNVFIRYRNVWCKCMLQPKSKWVTYTNCSSMITKKKEKNIKKCLFWRHNNRHLMQVLNRQLFDCDRCAIYDEQWWRFCSLKWDVGEWILLRWLCHLLLVFFESLILWCFSYTANTIPRRLKFLLSTSILNFWRQIIGLK